MIGVKRVRLKDLREDNDYTQTFIAEYLGVKQNTYSQYECEKREIPIALLIRLAKLYDTSVDYILGLTNNTKRYE
ncbi:MAG: helix-turn-helix transcriptional regulator [Clostridia bacterium]|nr:helix-turn-helix transcriptional regulator [Clostridia bacterium]